MALCNITEFSDAQIVDGFLLPAGKTAERTQNVTYTTAANSLATSDKTKFVRIIADAAVYISFNGAATASSIRIPADVIEYFGVEQGTVISCYDGTS